MLNNKGLTVFELLISLTIFSILIILGFTGFRSFQNKAHIYNTIRTVTSALNTARYKAIEENSSVKVILVEDRFFLKIKNNQDWKTINTFNLDEKTAVGMNASPVFYPTGYVSPLCSITIKNEKYSYKITLSIAGRIKVTKI